MKVFKKTRFGSCKTLLLYASMLIGCICYRFAFPIGGIKCSFKRGRQHKCWLKGKPPVLPSHLTLRSELSFHFKLLLNPLHTYLEEKSLKFCTFMGKYIHSFTSRHKICIFMISYYEKINLFKNSICYYTMNIIENESFTLQLFRKSLPYCLGEYFFIVFFFL